MKTKVSVSELKHRAMEHIMEEESLEPMFPVIVKEMAALEEVTDMGEDSGTAEISLHGEEQQRYIPAFMDGIQEENMGAKRGTAMHRVLECYDFTKPPETLEEQLQELEEQNKMEKELSRLVSLPSLKKFLSTKLGLRMQKAAKQGKLYREKPFVMGKPASEVLEESVSEEMVLIQGIIDVFFEEDDEIVLLDYKTDKVKTGDELANLYRTQLELYQEAIERAVGKKVKERLLYSFCLGEVVLV